MKPSVEKPRGWIPWFMLIIGLVSTVLVGVFLNQSTYEKDNERFEAEAQRVITAVTDRIGAHLSLLRAEAGLFAASERVTPAEFHAFAERVRLPQNYPGLQGIGFALRVSPEEAARVTEKLREEIHPNFSIWPEGDRPIYFPIVYLEPQDLRNQAAIGYDMFSDPVRNEAMSRARDTGAPAATAKVMLVQEITEDKQHGFLIYVPIYEDYRVPDSIAERRAKIRGFAYAPLRAEDFLFSIFSSFPPPLALKIYDGATPGPDDAPLASYGESPEEYDPRFVTRKTAEIAGHTWTFEISSLPKFEATSSRYISTYFLTIGGLVSFLIYALSLRQVEATRRAVRSAAELAESEAWMKFLSDASATLASSLDYAQTLRQVATMVTDGLADWCEVYVLDEQERIQRLILMHRDPEKARAAEAVRDRFPIHPEQDFGIPRVLRTGRSELYPEITDAILDQMLIEPERREVIKRFGLKSAMITPLMAFEKPIGAIAWANSDAGGRFSVDDLRLAEALASRAAVAIQNARLYEKAQREIENRRRAEGNLRELNQNLEVIVRERTRIAEDRAHQLRFLAHELTQAEQAERQRISQILHDDLQQILVATRLKLGSIRNETEARERIPEAQDLLSQAISSARNLNIELSPPVLQDRGLSAALEWLARKMLKSHELNIVLDLDPAAEPHSYDLKAFLLQSTREALFNVIKHAGVNEARVELKLSGENELCLKISDKGKGCEPSELHTTLSSDHFGLFNIKHRIELLGGTFHVDSVPGQGCTIVLCAPISLEDEEDHDSGDSRTGTAPN